tara:strand:- start:4909 stop:6312 length:1404 start_codon:yes stop_codon:yes gene_type:complete
MRKKNRILTESEKKQILKNKENLIVDNFRNVFNRIKRIDEQELNEISKITWEKLARSFGDKHPKFAERIRKHSSELGEDTIEPINLVYDRGGGETWDEDTKTKIIVSRPSYFSGVNSERLEVKFNNTPDELDKGKLYFVISESKLFITAYDGSMKMIPEKYSDLINLKKMFDIIGWKSSNSWKPNKRETSEYVNITTRYGKEKWEEEMRKRRGKESAEEEERKMVGRTEERDKREEERRKNEKEVKKLLENLGWQSGDIVYIVPPNDSPGRLNKDFINKVVSGKVNLDYVTNNFSGKAHIKLNDSENLGLNLELLAYVNNLTELKIDSKISVNIPKSINKLTNLVKLNIESRNERINLPNTIMGLKNLEYLRVDNLQQMYSIEELPKLKRLELGDGNNCSIEDIPHTLKTLKNLEHLSLTSCPVGRSGMDNLIALPNIQWLGLKDTNVHKNEIKYLRDKLKGTKIIN